MIPIEKVSTILRRYALCDACLGRQFAHALKADSNQQLGMEIRDAVGKKPGSETKEGECFICHPIREQLAKLEDTVSPRMADIECRTFLVGISIPDDVINKEDELRIRYSLLGSESIRREFSREAGKRLKDKLDLEIDFEKPDVALIFDLASKPPRLDIQINPLFVFGRYRKLERGISQTKRHCPACRGEGCELCLFSGYQSEESIESMISKDTAGAFGVSDWKFHGAGREDVDARMLGNGRPFVVEVLRPAKRMADLGELENRMNSKWQGKIEVLGLRYSTRREMQHIKTKKFDKTYEVIVAFSGNVDEASVRALTDTLSGCEIRQQTPLRVLPRRKDAVRRRMVKDLEIITLDMENRRVCMRLRSESGLYVKELMTGDEGRTQPNVRELLGMEKVEVESLDVVSVHDDF